MKEVKTTGEKGTTTTDLYQENRWIEEMFWLTADDTEEGLRADGLVPVQEKYPQEPIAGLPEDEDLWVRLTAEG